MSTVQLVRCEAVKLSLCLTVDLSNRDEVTISGSGDAVVLPSNASSHLHQLLNLQRNPQVTHAAPLLVSLFTA